MFTGFDSVIKELTKKVEGMALLNVGIGVLNVAVLAFIFTLLIKDYPLEAYNEKRIVFKIASAFVIGIVKGPLFIVAVYLSMHAFVNNASIPDSALRFLNISAACINLLFLMVVYTYFGSALLNLPLPSKIPWGESSHQPA